MATHAYTPLLTAPVLPLAALLSMSCVAACSGIPEEIEYTRQDRLNQLLDEYYSTKRYCSMRNLGVVVEQNRTQRCSGRERRLNGGFCPPRLGDRVLGCMPR